MQGAQVGQTIANGNHSLLAICNPGKIHSMIKDLFNIYNIYIYQSTELHWHTSNKTFNVSWEKICFEKFLSRQATTSQNTCLLLYLALKAIIGFYISDTFL